MSRTPPCPGNPEDYVLVKAKEGKHWRKKRGSIKSASLNTGYQTSADVTKIISPAAKKIRIALLPYLRGLSTGRLNVRIGNALRKSLKEKDRLELGHLNGIELQAEHPLDEILISGYHVSFDEKRVRIEIPIQKDSVMPMNRLVTHYYFEAVLLYGNAGTENGLQTESVESALYPVHENGKSICVLELELPEKDDWCVLLKLSSLEGNELAVHTKHYRMKVISVREE